MDFITIKEHMEINIISPSLTGPLTGKADSMELMDIENNCSFELDTSTLFSMFLVVSSKCTDTPKISENTRPMSFTRDSANLKYRDIYIKLKIVDR